MRKADHVRALKAEFPSLTNAEIARRAGCSSANVTMALQRTPRAVRLAYLHLTKEENDFIRREAQKSKIRFCEMVIAMLRDAIYEAQQQ